MARRDISPPTLVFPRTFRAAFLLLPLAVRRGYLRAVLPHWRWILAFAVVEMGAPWLLLSRAEQKLPSSTAGLLIASVPLIAALIYRLSPHTDRLMGRQLLGLLIGFAGVAVLVGVAVGNSDLPAVAEIGVVALGYSLGPLIVSRKLGQLPSLGVVSVALGLTAIGYAPFALARISHHVTGAVV